MDKDRLFVRNPKPNLGGDDPLFVLNEIYATDENRRAYGVTTDAEDEVARQASLQVQLLNQNPGRAFQQGVWSPFYDETAGPQQTDPGMKPCMVYSNADQYAGPAYSPTKMLMTDWMSCIHDDSPVGALSIPGTNFSMATVGGPSVQHQSWDIPTQLRAGIRYFDLMLYLTPDDIVFSNDPGQSIHDFMTPLAQFLKEHPREVAIVRIKDAGGGNMAFYSQLHQVLNDRYPDYILPLQLQNVLLGQARGKMMIVKDYYGGPPGGIEFTQTRALDGLSTFSPDEKDIKPLAKIMTKNLQKAIKSKKYHDLYITAAKAFGPGFPYQYAATLNEKLLFFLCKNPKGRIGILSMDFPAEHMVNAIIKRNFVPPKKM